MPTYYVWSTDRTEESNFWVYAIDDYDARQQVASTLSVAAHDESRFGCQEDDRFTMPLNKILHCSGEWTEVPEPKQPSKASGRDGGS